jgi:hypothetical protein
MEIILVMIVGASLLFAGTMLYNSLRDNAGAASAKVRTAALQGVVEKLISESPSGALPTADQLGAEWLRVRQDAKSSPWGGPATCGNGGIGSCPASTSIREIQVCETGINSRCFESGQIQGDAGVMVYLHYTPMPLANRRYPYVDVYDHSQKAYIRTLKYAIAAENQDGKQYYFVSGPHYTDQLTGQVASPSMVAGISGTSCVCSPFDTEGVITN